MFTVEVHREALGPTGSVIEATWIGDLTERAAWRIAHLAATFDGFRVAHVIAPDGSSVQAAGWVL